MSINLSDVRRVRATETTETEEAQRRAKLVAMDGIFGGPARRTFGAFVRPDYSPSLASRTKTEIDLVDLYTTKLPADEQKRRDLERAVDKLHPLVQEVNLNLPLLALQVLDKVHRWAGGTWKVIAPADIARALDSAPDAVRAALEHLVLLGCISQRRPGLATSAVEFRSNLPLSRTANPTKY